MKKILSVIFIILSGQVYAQSFENPVKQSFLNEIKKDYDNVMFIDNHKVIQDCRANHFDVVRFFVKQDKPNNALAASMVLVTLEKMDVYLALFIRMTEIYFIEKLGNNNNDENLDYSLDLILDTLLEIKEQSDTSLMVINNHEQIFEGVHAANIINLKREIRRIIRKCNRILDA